MNKNETQLIKGVAIFMMIFGHLFFLPDEVSQMHHFVTIDGDRWSAFYCICQVRCISF